MESTNAEEIVGQLLSNAREATDFVSSWNQEQIDMAVRALAWSVYEPSSARALAELAVETTGLGNVEDKVNKNQRKTFGTLRDLLRMPSVGIIERNPEKGLTIYAKPVGIVGSITPSTNPAATPINNAMMAINGANAIVLAPSPAGWETTNAVVEVARKALEQVGAPADLVQIVPAPVSRAVTSELMARVDLIVATGAQENVRAAYSSGTPAIGVGAGNVPVIIDASADLEEAARKIRLSKTFDNATSCSAENSIIIVDDVYEAAIEQLSKEGARLLESSSVNEVREALFPGGGDLNREVIAKDVSVLADVFGVEQSDNEYFLIEIDKPSVDEPLCREKLSLVSAVFRAADFDTALDYAAGILDVQGRGHSIGLHSKTPSHIQKAGESVDVARVLVNQAHAAGNGGSFDNGLPFSLSMGCGTWGRNSISENLNGRHFLNLTHVSETIPEDKPSEEELFGPLWNMTGDK